MPEEKKQSEGVQIDLAQFLNNVTSVIGDNVQWMRNKIIEQDSIIKQAAKIIADGRKENEDLKNQLQEAMGSSKGFKLGKK